MLPAGWMPVISLLMLSAGEPSSTVTSEALVPYRVDAFLHVEPHPAFAERWKSELLTDAQTMLARVVGPAWTIDLHLTDKPLPKDPPSSDHDKLLSARIRWNARANRAMMEVQEFDFASRTWSPSEKELISTNDRPGEAVVSRWLRVFRPLAKVLGKVRGQAEISLRADELIPKTSGYVQAPAGLPFTIWRQSNEANSSPEMVPWSYLILDRPKESNRPALVVKGEIASLMRDPLTRRSRKGMKIWAMATPLATSAATRIVFQSRPQGVPIAGHEVAAQYWGAPATYSMGVTNYRGEITIPSSLAGEGPGPLPRVTRVLLLSGSTVIAQFPLVPGSPAELKASAALDPLLGEIAGSMLSVQEEMVDQAARRKILETRLKRAAADNQLEQTQAIVQTINDLPSRETYRERLAQLREQTEARSKELKQPKLGSNVQRLFLQTDRLVESVPQEKIVIESPTPPSPPVDK